MSTSTPGPIPHTTTIDEAMAVLSDDPQVYNLPPDTPDEQVQERKQQAAQNLVLGSRANAAYWDSRSELEQLVARAQGHGQVTAPPIDDEAAEPLTAAPSVAAVDGTAEDVPPAQVNAPAPEGEPAQSVEDQLRAQLRAQGIEPDA